MVAVRIAESEPLRRTSPQRETDRADPEHEHERSQRHQRPLSARSGIAAEGGRVKSAPETPE